MVTEPATLPSGLRGRYQLQDPRMTLRQGLAEYYAVNPGLADPDSLDDRRIGGSTTCSRRPRPEEELAPSALGAPSGDPALLSERRNTNGSATPAAVGGAIETDALIFDGTLGARHLSVRQSA